MNLQYLGYIFEGISVLSGIIAGISALKKDPKYRINQLMASALFFMAFYVGFIMLYDIVFFETGNPNIIYISFPLALVCIVAASMLLYLSMKCITDSTDWLKTWWHWGIHLIILILFTIFITIYDFIEINTSEVVDTKMNPYVLGIVILIVLFYLIQSIFITYTHGIRRTGGITQKKLVIFEMGLLTNLVAVFVNIFSQLTENVIAGQILDVIFFGFLAVGNILFSIGFLISPSETKACLQCD